MVLQALCRQEAEGPAPGLGEERASGGGRRAGAYSPTHRAQVDDQQRGSADLLAEETLYIEDPQAGRWGQMF